MKSNEVIMVQTYLNSESYLNDNNDYKNYQEEKALRDLGLAYAKEYAEKFVEFRIYYNGVWHFYDDIKELNNFLQSNDLPLDFPRDIVTTYKLTFKQ